MLSDGLPLNRVRCELCVGMPCVDDWLGALRGTSAVLDGCDRQASQVLGAIAPPGRQPRLSQPAATSH